MASRYHEACIAAFNMAKKKLYDIDVDYFENIRRDGETLPEELTPSLRDEVVRAYGKEVRDLFSDAGLHAIASSGSEEGFPGADSAEIAAARQEARPDLLKLLIHEIPHFDVARYTDEDLECLYRDALKRNIVERIAKSNKADIIEFHHALLDSTVCACKKELGEILRKL